MFVPLRVEFENFLSFQERQEFFFRHDGVHFIYGIDYDADVDGDFTREQYNVGVGKSSLAMVMQFAIYGRIQKKIVKDRIVNKTTGKNLYVQFEFQMSNTGDTYRIERYRKHDEHKHNLYLYRQDPLSKKWQDISEVDKDATQSKINTLIVLDIRSFEKTNLFTREDRAPFLEISNLDRGTIFENIVNLNKVRPYADKIRKKLDEIEEKLLNINQDVLTTATLIKRDKEFVNEVQTTAEQKKKQLQKDIDEFKKEIQKLTSLNIPIKDIIKKVEEFKKLYVESKAIEDKMDKFTAEIETIDKLITSNQSTLKNLKKTQIKNKKVYDNHKPMTCHKCGAIQQEKEYKKEHNNLYDTLIRNINQQIIEETKTLEENEELKKDFQEQYDSLGLDLEEAKEKLDIFEMPKEIKKEIYEDNEVILSDLRNITEQLKLKKHELQSIDVDGQVQKLEKEIEDKRALLKTYEEERNKVRHTKEMLEFWNDALDFKNEASIKQYIISKIIPIFNHTLQQVIDAVYKGDMVISFDSFFNETIIYQDEQTVYDELSTGEKTKVNFCISLAIFDLTRINLDGCNVVFMDEIFNNIDLPTIIVFLEIIKEKYSSDSGVYIISHLQEVKDNLDPETIVRIEKKDRCSKIYLEK